MLSLLDHFGLPLFLFQCSPWDSLLAGSHRNDPAVWRCGSPLVIFRGRIHLFGLWGPATLHRWSYRAHHSAQQDDI